MERLDILWDWLFQILVCVVSLWKLHIAKVESIFTYAPVTITVSTPLNSKFTVCSRMQQIIKRKGKMLPCAPRNCLMIDYRRIRFGNAFIAVHKAFHLAEMTGIKEIHVPVGTAMLRESFKWHDISLIVDKEEHEMAKSFKECYNVRTYFGVPGVRNTSFDSSFKDGFAKQLNDVMHEFPDDLLAIHVRSGDIFSEKPHPRYGQPPCGYYREIIESRNWSKILLFAQDMMNPCIDVVRSYRAEHVKSSLRGEMGMMMSAKNFVIGRSTFGMILGSVSTKIRNLWTCGNADDWDYYCTGAHRRNYGTPRQFDCSPIDGYMNHVMALGKWKNTPEQHKWMLNSTCKEWLVIEDSITPENKGKVVERLRDAIF